MFWSEQHPNLHERCKELSAENKVGRSRNQSAQVDDGTDLSIKMAAWAMQLSAQALSPNLQRRQEQNCFICTNYLHMIQGHEAHTSSPPSRLSRPIAALVYTPRVLARGIIKELRPQAMLDAETSADVVEVVRQSR